MTQFIPYFQPLASWTEAHKKACWQSLVQPSFSAFLCMLKHQPCEKCFNSAQKFVAVFLTWSIKAANKNCWKAKVSKDFLQILCFRSCFIRKHLHSMRHGKSVMTTIISSKFSLMSFLLFPFSLKSLILLFRIQKSWQILLLMRFFLELGVNLLSYSYRQGHKMYAENECQQWNSIWKVCEKKKWKRFLTSSSPPSTQRS